MQSPNRVQRWTGHLLAHALFSITMSGSIALAQSGHLENGPSNNSVIKFEVFSIRPSAKGQGSVHAEVTSDGFTVTATLFDLIEMVYNPMSSALYWNDKSMLNLPAWGHEERYSINARVSNEDLPVWQAQGEDRTGAVVTDVLRGALRTALEERCNLTVKVTPTLVPDLNLLVDKHGARLKEWKSDDAKTIKIGTLRTLLGKGFYYDADGTRHYIGVSMEEFARYLTRFSPDLPIQDKTGLEGRYDFDLPFHDITDASLSDIGTPLDRILIHDIGLTLKPGKGTSYILDIKGIKRPDPN